MCWISSVEEICWPEQVLKGVKNSKGLNLKGFSFKNDFLHWQIAWIICGSADYFFFFFNLYSFSQRSFSLLQYSMVFYAKLVISQCYSFLCFANLTCSLPLPVLSSPHVIHSFICLSVHLSSWLHADLEMESVIEDSTWVADPLNHYSISSGRQKPDLCVFYHPPLTKIIIIKLWSMSLQCVPLILLLSVVIYDYVKGSFVWIEDDSLSNTSDSVVRIWEGLNGVCVCV